MTKASVIWWDDQISLYIKFENFPNTEFLSVKEKFKAHFPKARWIMDVKAWNLPLTEMQELAVFVEENIGRCTLRHRHSIGTPIQLPLPLNWHTNPKTCDRKRKNG